MAKKPKQPRQKKQTQQPKAAKQPKQAKPPEGAAEAKKVLDAFLDASLRRDKRAMRACVTRRTLKSGHLDSSPEGVTFVVGDARAEGEEVIFPVKAFQVGAPKGAEPVMELPCRMTKEDGRWKFDLAGTVERMTAGIEQAMGQAMGQVATAMSAAMEGVGKAMAEGLSEAFGKEAPEATEPAQSWDDAPLTPAPEEFLPVQEMQPLPKTQAALTEAVASPVLMQAAIADLLRRIGSDDRDTLFNWFEDQLFAGWAAMLSQAAEQVPLKGRLRAVRIESTSRPEHRLLAIDGSDLVYRMMLPDSEGFFQDDEARERLPGVLAGLPEAIDPSTAGRRLLPNEDETPSLDLYRERVAPRTMRRISSIVGHNVALGVEWDQLREWTDAARDLRLWGLNRVLGGVALACADPSERRKLAAGLARIRIIRGYESSRRYARYEDGTLEFGLNPWGGDHKSPYEHEVARALAGEPVE